MENICGILYEKFRPFIIQLNHMETLAELCNILKVEMLEDHIQKRGKAKKMTSGLLLHVPIFRPSSGNVHNTVQHGELHIYYRPTSLE